MFQILLISIGVAQPLILSFCFWNLWKRVCVDRKSLRDLSVLFLTPILSPIILGVSSWNFAGSFCNFPDKGLKQDIGVIALSLLLTNAMFSYSLYSMVKGHYRILSALGVLISGLVVLVESFYLSMIITI